MLPYIFTVAVFVSSVLTRNCQNTSFDKGLNVTTSPDFPTCANDVSLTTFFGATKNVTVQPDCDNAIFRACDASSLVWENYGDGTGFLFNIKSVSSSCEVDILWDQDLDYWNSSTCTMTLQSITEDCMLIGTGKYAQVGGQAGVRSLQYQAPNGTGSQAEFGPNILCDNVAPVFMVGPPGYFNDQSNQYWTPEALTDLCVNYQNCTSLPYNGTNADQANQAWSEII